MNNSRKKIDEYYILLFFPIIFILIAFILEGFSEVFLNFKSILFSRSILLVDYLAIGGVGGSLLNSAIVSLIAIFLIYVSGREIDGLAIASVYITTGFAFMGKNALNVLPIYLGGYIYSIVSKEKFKNCIINVIFSATLAPIVNEIIYNFGNENFYGIIFAILMGVFIGFIINPLARYMSKFHEGYSLYNMGFTAGILGTVIIAVLKGFGIEFERQSVISTEYNMIMAIILLTSFFLMILVGYILENYSIKGYRKILKEKGRSPNSYIDTYGSGATLINMGILGIVGIAYVFISKGDLHGPAIAGIITLSGFGSNGKHIRNITPIMLGVFLMANISVMDPSSPSVVIAGLFGTTLAPISGEFGIIAGIIAGGLHVLVGPNILPIHSGINLYNNGFSGGIVAGFMLPICRKIREIKDKC